jgi:hypothetical protein
MVCIISERLRAYWTYVATSLGMEVTDDPQLADVVLVECAAKEERHPQYRHSMVMVFRAAIDVSQLPLNCAVIGTHVSGDPWLEGGAVLEMGSWYKNKTARNQHKGVMLTGIELEVPVCVSLADKAEVDKEMVAESKSSEHWRAHQEVLSNLRGTLARLLQEERERIVGRIAKLEEELAQLDARIGDME